MTFGKELGIYNEAFAAGAASRDAEIAELNGANVLNRNALRLQKEKTDQLREQVKILRDALMRIAVDDCGCGVPCDCYSWASMSDTAIKALANRRKP